VSSVIISEVLDDISSHWLPTRLVSIAALLGRYSPSPHSLLRLICHVPDLAHYYRLCRAKVVNLTRLYSGFRGTESAPRAPKQEPSRRERAHEAPRAGQDSPASAGTTP
jgi:hypothetical protein